MLTVAISTSSGQFALVIGADNHILFDSSAYPEHERELDDALSAGLTHCNREITEIGQIIVDIGPGGTSRVRTGIAFANALAYSAGIGVATVSSMELAGIDAGYKFGGLPVVNTVKSIKGNAYIGLYNQRLISIDYGTVHDMVPKLVRDFDKFTVVGFHRDAILRMPALKDKFIIDSMMSFGNVRIMIEKSDLFTRNPLHFPTFAQPITEKTLIHHE